MPEGAWPVTLLNLMLPLIAYGGGTDTVVVYSAKDAEVEIRTNIVAVTVLESGGGKTLNYNYCADVLAEVASQVEPTLIRQFIAAKKNQKKEKLIVSGVHQGGQSLNIIRMTKP